MPERSVKNIITLLLSLLLISGLAATVFSQESKIGGVINTYKRVISLGPPANRVTVDNTVSLNPGDTVLLIQMKGVIIYITESPTYGSYRESSGKPGATEFLIVSSVNSSAKTITFTNNISGNFNAAGLVQLIRVPTFNSAKVTTTLSCQPWDSTLKTGGVLALMVSKNLSLGANIDVSGKGFAGGTPSPGTGICQLTNEAVYNKYSYPNSDLNSGQKGESQVSKCYIDNLNIPRAFPLYARGKGNNFTGGGGGNGKYSGGGGGSTYGTGGKGGRELATCSPLPGDGGIGGRAVDNTTDIGGGLFPGSGGGSSTYEAGSTASPGGRGGGIIIIFCDTLKGNGNSIKADGASPEVTANGTAGAGGGGGGGSIALWVRSFSLSGLIISSGGAKGGNTLNSFGEGGGGGGGLISANNITVPSNVTLTIAGGPGGSRTGGTTSGTAGSSGKTLNTYSPVFSGFMFNYIFSSETLVETDSICSNMIPPMIKGSRPAGGTPPYTYKWEKSYNKDFLSPILLINDSDPLNYTPLTNETSAINDTVWFRRTITDNAANKDVSNPVIFVIQRAVRNNFLVDTPDTLCFSSDPPLLQQGVPDLVVPSSKSLLFNWQSSLNSGSTWGTSISSSKNYDPPAGLKINTWFRRTVSSGRCIDSSAVVSITVLPQIKNNVSGSASICFNSAPVILNGDSPAYGANKFSFAWQDSLTVAGWKDAEGGTVEDFTLSPVSSAKYRRLVFLGNNNLCKDTSAVLTIKVNPLPTASIVKTADTTICEGSKVSLKLRLTGGSAWELVYNENLTGKPALRIARTDTTVLLNPSVGAGTASAVFKYSIKSVKDGNGCQPVSLNDTLIANVYKTPVAFAGQDASTCGPVITLEAVSDIGIGKWTLPAGASVSAGDDPNATVTIDGAFSGGAITHKFIWEMTNWQCTTIDTVIIRFDKQIGPVSAGKDAVVYSFDNIVSIAASPLKAWETGKWSVTAGAGKIDEIEKSSTIVRSLSTGDNAFLWTVTNGECQSEDRLDLLVHEEFIPGGFSPNNDAFNNTFVISGLDLSNQTAELSILNTSGNEVFSTTNRDGKTWVDWTGSNSRGVALPEGTYYYFLKVSSNLSGLVFKRSGFVLLKRF